MAQLRDKATSQILHEGTPLECVTIARQLGLENVVFDDVGEGFDADVVWDNNQQTIAAWQAVTSSSTVDQAGKDQAQQAIQDIDQEISDAQTQASDVAARQAAIQAGDQVPPLS